MTKKKRRRRSHTRSKPKKKPKIRYNDVEGLEYPVLDQSCE